MYYSHQYVSNSDLKRLDARFIGNARPEPENIEEIFDLGTLIHQVLLEPYKADKNHKDYKLAEEMAWTFLKDKTCGQFFRMHDFRREHEFYRVNVHGLKARCKMDGDSKSARTILEYKGLSVTSDKQFEDAIYNFDYDQGAAWYMDTTGFSRLLMVAVSKKRPKLIYKRLIDRNSKIYHSGVDKVKRKVQQWKMFFEGDDTIVML